MVCACHRVYSELPLIRTLCQFPRVAGLEGVHCTLKQAPPKTTTNHKLPMYTLRHSQTQLVTASVELLNLRIMSNDESSCIIMCGFKKTGFVLEHSNVV